MGFAGLEHQTIGTEKTARSRAELPIDSYGFMLDYRPLSQRVES
jgi:hypothetical protein